MGLCISTTSRVQSTGNIGQGATSGESQLQSPHSTSTSSIHILDDDSLLHVFYLYRPFLLGEDEGEADRLYGGTRDWVRGRWWYGLAHVCQRWRNVILGSASYLGVSLICTYGTPVADMLAHSPPLPLVIDYFYEDHDITKDEEGAVLALKQRDRVRRVRLMMPVPDLLKLISAMDEEYPILEYLIIEPPTKDRSTILMLPETLQAPNLRHLTLIGFALPIGSRLLTTAVGLVTLCLIMNDPSTYFHPNALLHWLSLMPQLKTFVIIFLFAVPNHEILRQLTHTPILTPVALSNLRLFRFGGGSAYLEALVRRVTTPRLETLEIFFFNQLTFSVPRLQQFSNTAENLSLRFDSAELRFYEKQVYVVVYPPGEAEMYTLFIDVSCCHLDWQVSSMAQISSSLSQLFSAVEHLALEHSVHHLSSEEHNEVDRAEWCKLLRSFRNVKTLRIDNGLVEQLSRCLQLDDGELPLELLPELQELTYSGSGDAFTSFVHARQNADRAVTLVRRSPSLQSVHIPVHVPSISYSITPASNEAGNDFDT